MAKSTLREERPLNPLLMRIFSRLCHDIISDDSRQKAMSLATKQITGNIN